MSAARSRPAATLEVRLARAEAKVAQLRAAIAAEAARVSFVGPLRHFTREEDSFMTTGARTASACVDPTTMDSWLRGCESHGCLDAPDWIPAGGHRVICIGPWAYADASVARGAA